VVARQNHIAPAAVQKLLTPPEEDTRSGGVSSKTFQFIANKNVEHDLSL
jgi:hypothetical protein